MIANLTMTAVLEVLVNARPEIKQRLIERRMQRWLLVAKYPSIDNRYTPAKARRNFWRLIKAHPQTADRLSLTPVSVYDR